MDLTAAEIVKLAGPVLIGSILNWGMLGILTVQVFLYSQAFPNDRPTLKATVYGIYLLEIAQTIVFTVNAWAIFVKGFGHNDTLFATGTTGVSACLLGGATTMVAQTLYAYRIMIISESKIIPSFIVLMSLTSFIAAVLVGVLGEQTRNLFSNQVHALRISSLIGVWIGASSVCDMMIAASMCFYLSKRIRDGIFPKMQALVYRVMCMTVETGASTATVSIISMGMFYAPNIGGFRYYAVPLTVLAKLYSNTMLVLLNSRIKLGIVSESTTWREHELSPISLSHPRQTDGIEIRFTSSNTSEVANADGTEGEGIAMDEAKITSSVSRSWEGISSTNEEYAL